MMAAPKVAMMTFALLKRGISYLDTPVHPNCWYWMGRARIRFHQADAGQHEPHASQPKAFRARQLRQGAHSYAMK